jgi:hypothetical protein
MRFPRERRLPSEFESCPKLDVVGEGRAKLGEVLATMVGHPDCLVRPFDLSHSACWCYQTVYEALPPDQSTPIWTVTRRFAVVPYLKLHRTLFRPDIPIRWKCTFEIIHFPRARNLYFDLEQYRPSHLTVPEHDARCWHKVQLLCQLVRDLFQYASQCFSLCMYMLYSE